MGHGNLIRRILSRLEQAEWSEPNPHFQDDYRIAWITVRYAARGRKQPLVAATYVVLGLHPDKVWPAIVARRRALLGPSYSKFFGLNPPAMRANDVRWKKPAQSVQDARGGVTRKRAA